MYIENVRATLTTEFGKNIADEVIETIVKELAGEGLEIVMEPDKIVLKGKHFEYTQDDLGVMKSAKLDGVQLKAVTELIVHAHCDAATKVIVKTYF